MRGTGLVLPHLHTRSKIETHAPYPPYAFETGRLYRIPGTRELWVAQSGSAGLIDFGPDSFYFWAHHARRATDRTWIAPRRHIDEPFEGVMPNYRPFARKIPAASLIPTVATIDSHPSVRCPEWFCTGRCRYARERLWRTVPDLFP